LIGKKKPRVKNLETVFMNADPKNCFVLDLNVYNFETLVHKKKQKKRLGQKSRICSGTYLNRG
jgi:hypothetical protein